MTRRRAASFIEIACPDGRRFLIETPGQPMLDAVLAAIGILPKHRNAPVNRYTRDALEADAQAFRAREPVQ